MEVLSVGVFNGSPEASQQSTEDMPEGGWRSYYEHPLTAAATAMLNIEGQANTQQTYDYFKTTALNEKVNGSTAPLPEIWTTVRSKSSSPMFLDPKSGCRSPSSHSVSPPVQIKQESGSPELDSEFSSANYEALNQYSVLANASPPPQYSTGSNQHFFYPSDQYLSVRSHLSYADNGDGGFVERYFRGYKGLTVDLPSPDSGIGESTPRDNLPQMFDYSELGANQNGLQTVSSSPESVRVRSRNWQEFGRNPESDKIHIAKIHSDFGFKYYLESPISTSQRREDDRITYINKGQFYGISMDYIPDQSRQLKSPTIKTLVMLVFREEKSSEDELKAWQFWHSRQHSIKQRILDADTKNSVGIIGHIEEIAHNAVAFYWSPLEGPAKISVAVQCLSTDFSNQKGVKGLPLHLQIDSYDDGREGATPIHRGYCQIKVFCDKGAERKTRDEERRAAKRKLTATNTGRKKIEDMYHSPCERSDFYSMSDIAKPPVLFNPGDALEKMPGVDLAFYGAAPGIVEDHSNHECMDAVVEAPELRPVDVALPPTKRSKVYPNDRVLLYARQEGEDIFHALHLIPPSLSGLAVANDCTYG